MSIVTRVIAERNYRHFIKSCIAKRLGGKVEDFNSWRTTMEPDELLYEFVLAKSREFLKHQQEDLNDPNFLNSVANHIVEYLWKYRQRFGSDFTRENIFESLCFWNSYVGNKGNRKTKNKINKAEAFFSSQQTARYAELLLERGENLDIIKGGAENVYKREKVRVRIKKSR